MHKTYNPPNVHKPVAPYSHAIEVPPNARWLFLAGQTGHALDGTCPPGIEAQAELVWSNIVKVLEAAGMGVENIVRVTQYVTSREYRTASAAARTKVLGSLRPASTFLIVAGLGRPDMLIEVDIVAAKA